MTTFSEQLATDATNVFLDTDELAELVTYYPYGDPSRAVSTSASVSQDHLEGTREVRGDGVVINQDKGESIRESMMVWLAATVDCDPTRRPHDLIKLADDRVVLVKRIMARDAGMIKVWCVRRDDITIRRPSKSG